MPSIVHSPTLAASAPHAAAGLADCDIEDVGLRVRADSDGRYRFALPQPGTGATRRDRFVIPPPPAFGLSSPTQPCTTPPPITDVGQRVVNASCDHGSGSVPADTPTLSTLPGYCGSPAPPSSPDGSCDDAWSDTSDFLDAPPIDIPGGPCGAAQVASGGVGDAALGGAASLVPTPPVLVEPISAQVVALIAANRKAALGRKHASCVGSLTPEQNQAVDVALSGANLFLSGQAGTGKSRALMARLHTISKSVSMVILV